MKKLILIGLMCFVGLVGNHASGQKVSTQERQRTLYRQAMDLYGKQKYAAGSTARLWIFMGNRNMLLPSRFLTR